MRHKVYLKDLLQTLTSSKGRFFSILSLMLIGSLTLIGLKSSSPNMERTAQTYIENHQLMDLTVLASHGLSQSDREELESIKGLTVDYGYLLDLVIRDTDQAVRLFSDSKKLSTYDFVVGKMPEKSGQIALSSNQRGAYQLGDTISFTAKDEVSGLLEVLDFTVTGFIQSSEIWNQTNLGSTPVGSGDLAAYGVIWDKDFKSPDYLLARLQFEDLAGLAYNSPAYEQRLKDHQTEVEDLLKDKGERRRQELTAAGQKSISEGEAELGLAREQLRAAKSQLERVARLAGGQGLEQEQAHLAENEKILAQKEAELAAAKETLSAFPLPSYQVYSRATLPGGVGYGVYKNATASISAVSNIFPSLLYLVAALVTLMTMTRFVDEERAKAGLFKALGYSKRAITARFVLYGLAAGLTGTLVGSFLGSFYLAPMIARIVTQQTVLGEAGVTLYPSYLLLALGLAILSAVFPAYWVARKELKEEPARLLLPKPPVSGAKIWLERWSRVWSRLSFSYKVTTRNIFRYKHRMFMTIFGVAGSVALLFAGLGLRSSISGVSQSQFGQILAYDLLLLENPALTSKEKEEIEAFLAGEEVAGSLAVSSQLLQEEVVGSKERQTISLMVTEEQKDLPNFVKLKEVGRDKELALPDEGLLISQRLAQLYQVQAGDHISLNLSGKKVEAKVAGLVQLYAGHFIYMTGSYYEKLTGESYQPTAYLVSLKSSAKKILKDTSVEALSLSGVSAVVQNTSLIQQLGSIVRSLQSVMGILVLLSLLLGLVILYNLTNINLAERVRELSTIKVLGFHTSEVTLYIYRETVVLSLLGVVLGLVGGQFLHGLLLSLIASDTTIFPRKVGLEVYLLPIFMIGLIVLVLGCLVHRRMKELDMLEALKSVD